MGNEYHRDLILTHDDDFFKHRDKSFNFQLTVAPFVPKSA